MSSYKSAERERLLQERIDTIRRKEKERLARFKEVQAEAKAERVSETVISYQEIVTPSSDWDSSTEGRLKGVQSNSQSAPRGQVRGRGRGRGDKTTSTLTAQSHRSPGWKNENLQLREEREQIYKARLARGKTKTGEWRREWDAGKTEDGRISAQVNDIDWSKSQRSSTNTTDGWSSPNCEEAKGKDSWSPAQQVTNGDSDWQDVENQRSSTETIDGWSSPNCDVAKGKDSWSPVAQVTNGDSDWQDVESWQSLTETTDGWSSPNCEEVKGKDSWSPVTQVTNGDNDDRDVDRSLGTLTMAASDPSSEKTSVGSNNYLQSKAHSTEQSSSFVYAEPVSKASCGHLNGCAPRFDVNSAAFTSTSDSGHICGQNDALNMELQRAQHTATNTVPHIGQQSSERNEAAAASTSRKTPARNSNGRLSMAEFVGLLRSIDQQQCAPSQNTILHSGVLVVSRPKQ